MYADTGNMEFPGVLVVKNPPGNGGDVRDVSRCAFDPWVRKIPWRRAWQPTPVFLPGEFHGQGRLESYSPRGRKELNTLMPLGTLLIYTALLQPCSSDMNGTKITWDLANVSVDFRRGEENPRWP